MDKPSHIEFENRKNPRAAFDIVNIQNIHSMKNMDHSPYEHHLVEFYLIIFVEDGQGIHTVDFIEYECKAGSILTIRKDQINKFSLSKVLKGKMLLFLSDFLLSYLEKLEAQKTLLLFNELLGSPRIDLPADDFREIQSLIHRIEKEYFKVHDEYTLGIIRSELHILITKLLRIKSESKQINLNRKYLEAFIRFQQLVEKHANKTNKVLDYARMMGLSTKSLNNITKSIVRKSAKVFIDELCIQQIKRLLINTEDSIKEIAFASGFEEPTNFYKYFKRHTQSTPEQFRSLH